MIYSLNMQMNQTSNTATAPTTAEDPSQSYQCGYSDAVIYGLPRFIRDSSDRIEYQEGYEQGLADAKARAKAKAATIAVVATCSSASKARLEAAKHFGSWTEILDRNTYLVKVYAD